jgi:heme exporter protein CcmD
MRDFLHMSGYGTYVWGSYGIWLAIVVWNVWAALRMRSQARVRALRRTEAAATARPFPAERHGSEIQESA